MKMSCGGGGSQFQAPRLLRAEGISTHIGREGKPVERELAAEKRAPFAIRLTERLSTFPSGE